MKRILLASTAALSLLAGAALAQSSVAEQVISGLQAQGFTRIEVKQGPTQLKVEAIQGDTKVEYVYDLASGDVLSQETERVDDDDDTAPGVEIDREEEDFVSVPGAVMDDDDGDDDGSDDDDDDRGHGNDDDHDDDDNPGRGGDDDDEDGDDNRGHGNDDDHDDDDNSGRGGDDDDNDDDDSDNGDDDDGDDD
jgi:hypothetical protein